MRSATNLLHVTPDFGCLHFARCAAASSIADLTSDSDGIGFIRWASSLVKSQRPEKVLAHEYDHNWTVQSAPNHFGFDRVPM